MMSEGLGSSTLQSFSQHLQLPRANLPGEGVSAPTPTRADMGHGSWVTWIKNVMGSVYSRHLWGKFTPRPQIRIPPPQKKDSDGIL